MTRVLLKCLVCLCVILLGFVLLTRPIGRVLPHGQYIPITIQNELQGFDDMYLLDVDRVIAERLFTGFAHLGEYSMSSDGGRIALNFFAKAQNNCTLSIYSWADDKIEYFPAPETCVPLAPHWSPDNRHIVFYTLSKGNLYNLSLDTGDVQLIYGDQSLNINPVWSPDGKLLAFISNPDKNLQASSFTGLKSPKRLQFVHMDCSVNCEQVNGLFVSLNYPILRLSWSPDQRYVALFSTGGGLGVRLYIWNADCLAEKVPDCRLQRHELKEIVLRKTIILADPEPIWSTDGHYLMFAAMVNGHAGFYRVPANCYDIVEGCKPGILLDFDKVVSARR